MSEEIKSIDKVRISRKPLQIAPSAARRHIRQRKENGGNGHQRKIKWFEHGKCVGKAPLLPTNTRQARTVCPVMI